MPTTLIHNFPSTAASPAADDFLPLDGATNGSRKWASSHFQNLGSADSPTFATVTATANVVDSKGNVRTITQNSKTTSYTLIASDAGKHISTNSGVIIPSGVFSAGDAITIVNNSSSTINITATAVTCYYSGTALTGNRTLAQRGVATALCIASDTFVIAGAGLS
jgi:hypothetical protein